MKEFALQGYAHVDIDETILTVYERMMNDYLRDAEGVPADRLVELRYDELDAEPIKSVEQVYRRLSLPGFDDARPKFERYLASVATFKKNKFDYSDEAAAKVEARLKPFLERWGYERPGRKAEDVAGPDNNDEGAAEGASHGETAA